MASKRRLRRKACLHKKGHATCAEAEVAAARTPGVRPYHCPHCGRWHVGHETRALRQARLKAQFLWR